jgi:hypothetical protein
MDVLTAYLEYRVSFSYVSVITEIRTYGIVNFIYGVAVTSKRNAA